MAMVQQRLDVCSLPLLVQACLGAPAALCQQREPAGASSGGMASQAVLKQSIFTLQPCVSEQTSWACRLSQSQRLKPA
jgi:hypothetical protein